MTNMRTMIKLTLILFAFLGVNAVAGKSGVYAKSIKNTKKMVNEEWLRNTFPNINNCTPNNWYFDPEKKTSDGRTLESRGYKPYLVDEYFARYKVAEQFYGFKVNEIWIPSSFYEIVTITIDADIYAVQKKIQKITGEIVQIYHSKNNQPSMTQAYLYTENKKTIFVCLTKE